MLLEISGICQNCAEDVNILIHEGELIEDCAKCGEPPFSVATVPGIIYIVSNPNQTGVKIGRTKKSIMQRGKELSSTGVNGNFVPIAFFPSQRPQQDEKKAHAKLAKFKMDKEHFELEEVEAVLKVYRALNKRIEPVFLDAELEKTFRLKLEKAKIEMQLRLQGKKKK